MQPPPLLSASTPGIVLSIAANIDHYNPLQPLFHLNGNLDIDQVTFTPIPNAAHASVISSYRRHSSGSTSIATLSSSPRTHQSDNSSIDRPPSPAATEHAPLVAVVDRLIARGEIWDVYGATLDERSVVIKLFNRFGRQWASEKTPVEDRDLLSYAEAVNAVKREDQILSLLNSRSGDEKGERISPQYFGMWTEGSGGIFVQIMEDGGAALGSDDCFYGIDEDLGVQTRALYNRLHAIPIVHGKLDLGHLLVDPSGNVTLIGYTRAWVTKHDSGALQSEQRVLERFLPVRCAGTTETQSGKISRQGYGGSATAQSSFHKAAVTALTSGPPIASK